MTNADEPAYPAVLTEQLEEGLDVNIERQYQGLTKREYFSGIAPTKIPTWFKPVLPEKPKEPKHWVELPNDDIRKKELEGWHKDPSYDLLENNELSWYQVAWEQYWSDRTDWEKECEKQKYFQWRCFYADELLKQLETDKTK